MGLHLPERPSGRVTFMATYKGDAPAWFGVETSGACLDLERIVGDDGRGGWSVEAPVESGCTGYRFVWETDDGSIRSMPTSGGYQYGQGCEAWVEDAPAGCDYDPGTLDTGWTDTGTVAVDCPPNSEDRNGDCRPDRGIEGDTSGGCGCAGTSTAGAIWALVLAVLGVRRRRRA